MFWEAMRVGIILRSVCLSGASRGAELFLHSQGAVQGASFLHSNDHTGAHRPLGSPMAATSSSEPEERPAALAAAAASLPRMPLGLSRVTTRRGCVPGPSQFAVSTLVACVCRDCWGDVSILRTWRLRPQPEESLNSSQSRFGSGCFGYPCTGVTYNHADLWWTCCWRKLKSRRNISPLAGTQRPLQPLWQ
eukprot:scaffold42891_cov31-Prasinocladus_malaysianus.AAC.1